MRKIINYLFAFAIISFISLNAISQTLEVEKSHLLSKDAKKGFLGSFRYDPGTKQYILIFERDSKKEATFETMKFDYDFKLLDDNSEVFQLVDAHKKYDFVEYDEEKWKEPVVVRVDATMLGKGNVVLRKGNISREWSSSSTTFNVSGDWITAYTTPGYWKYTFNETNKVTPKIQIPVTISPKAPGFVRKAIENQAEKVYLVSYMTDEPNIDVQMGRRFFFPHAMKSAYMSPKKAFSSATGDIMVLGKQVVAFDTTYICRFVALKYSAGDLSEKNRNLIEFKYGSDVIYSQLLPDKTMAVIFAPLPKSQVKPGKPNPDSRAYTFIRIDMDANIKERIDFKSPSSKWEISTMELSEDGNLYIYGPASQSKNDKYFAEQFGKNYDNFQFMKIANGKLAFLTSIKNDDFEKKMKMPPNMKKIDAYSGNSLQFGSLIFASGGDILLPGQEFSSGPKGNDAKFGNIFLFHFNPDGSLKTIYGYKKEETGKEATVNASLNTVFENVDKKTLTFMVYEFAGSTDEKMLIYPKIATIDLASATISEFSQFGYTKNEEFYLDNGKPVILIDDDQKLVFFGADKKNKNIWFGRVKLGKK